MARKYDYSVVNPNTIYRRGESFVYRNIAGESILVPIRQHVADLQSIYVLNSVGAFIWDCLDGQRSVLQIKQSLLDTFDVTDEEGKADMVAFLKQLIGIGAIQEI